MELVNVEMEDRIVFSEEILRVVLEDWDFLRWLLVEVLVICKEN